MRPAAVPYRPVFIERTARIRTTHTMGPKPATRSTSGDAGGDAALRLVEVLNDEALMKKLRTALFPQALSDKFDRQNDQINRLLAQLTVSNQRVDELEKRVRELEEQADRTEQYTRRSNLLCSGLPETGVGEDTEEKILAVINDMMEMRPPLTSSDIARSHRLGGRQV